MACLIIIAEVTLFVSHRLKTTKGSITPKINENPPRRPKSNKSSFAIVDDLITFMCRWMVCSWIKRGANLGARTLKNKSFPLRWCQQQQTLEPLKFHLMKRNLNNSQISLNPRVSRKWIFFTQNMWRVLQQEVWSPARLAHTLILCVEFRHCQ